MARKKKTSVEEIEFDEDTGDDTNEDTNEDTGENGEDTGENGEQISIPGIDTSEPAQKRPRKQKCFVFVQDENGSSVVELEKKRDLNAWIAEHCVSLTMSDIESGVLPMDNGGTAQPIVGRRIKAKSTVSIV